MPVTKQDDIHKRVTYYSVRTCTIRDNNYIIKKVHDWQIHNKKGENILVRGIKALLGVLDKGFNSWNNLKHTDLWEMTAPSSIILCLNKSVNNIDCQHFYFLVHLQKKLIFISCYHDDDVFWWVDTTTEARLLSKEETFLV